MLTNVVWSVISVQLYILTVNFILFHSYSMKKTLSTLVTSAAILTGCAAPVPTQLKTTEKITNLVNNTKSYISEKTNFYFGNMDVDMNTKTVTDDFYANKSEGTGAGEFKRTISAANTGKDELIKDAKLSDVNIIPDFNPLLIEATKNEMNKVLVNEDLSEVISMSYKGNNMITIKKKDKTYKVEIKCGAAAKSAAECTAVTSDVNTSTPATAPTPTASASVAPSAAPTVAPSAAPKFPTLNVPNATTVKSEIATASLVATFDNQLFESVKLIQDSATTLVSIVIVYKKNEDAAAAKIFDATTKDMTTLKAPLNSRTITINVAKASELPGTTASYVFSQGGETREVDFTLTGKKN